MSIVHPITMTSVPDCHTLEESFPGVSTFLFDMDGTLLDTEKYHTLAMQAIGHHYQVVAPFGPKELHALMMGKADHLVYEIIKDWPGMPRHWSAQDFINEKNARLLELISKVDGDTYISPKIRELLNELKSRGYRVGLVTSSEKIVTTELLKLAKVTQMFDYVLTRDDTLKVKPDPWPYLKAMEHFKSLPESTLIFEDSSVGLEAARNSGAHLIQAKWY